MENEVNEIKHFLNPDLEKANSEIEKSAEDSFLYILVEKGEILLGHSGSKILLKSHQIGVFIPRAQLQISGIQDSSSFHLLIVKDTLYGVEIFRYKMYYQYMLYQHPIISVDEHDFTSMILLMERIHGLLSYPEHFFWKASLQAAFYSLLLEIANSCLKGHDTRVNLHTKKDEVFREFIQLASKNYKMEHGIEFYADKMCMTSQNLTQVITQITGISPVGILRNLLFQEARLLLHDSSRTILQISEELGFSDQSSFGKFFRSNEGMTPAEFRRRHLI